MFAIGPRRRMGGYHARRLLADRPVDGVPGTWVHLVASMQRHTVYGGLAQLRPEERQVITMVHLEGRTHRQIAAALGMSVSTVGRRLRMARERLEDYGVEETQVPMYVRNAVAYRRMRLDSLLDTSRTAKMVVPRGPTWLPATIVAAAVTTITLGLIGASADSPSTVPPFSPMMAWVPPIPVNLLHYTPITTATLIEPWIGGSMGNHPDQAPERFSPRAQYPRQNLITSTSGPSRLTKTPPPPPPHKKKPKRGPAPAPLKPAAP